jgi:hypothetical protein
MDHLACSFSDSPCVFRVHAQIVLHGHLLLLHHSELNNKGSNGNGCVSLSAGTLCHWKFIHSLLYVV